MKRGFVLTESEKNRIRGIYQTILEQAPPPKPTDPAEVTKFEEYMDNTYGNWMTYNKKTGRKGKAKNSGRMGNPDSYSYTKAWGEHGQEYLDKIGKSGTPTPPVAPSAATDTNQYGYFDKATNKFVGPKTKTEMDSLIANGTITDESWITSKPQGGKWAQYTKAKESQNFDFGPGLPPDTELKIPGVNTSGSSVSGSGTTSGSTTTLNPVGQPDEIKTVSSADQTYGVGGTIKRPDNKVNPFATGAGGTNDFTTSGFSTWYSSIYGDNPPATPVVDEKTKTATVTVGDKQMKFTYNQVLSDWNLPSSSTPGTTVITQKKTDKTQSSNASSGATASAPTQ